MWSAWRRPTICSPTGSPALVKPTGTVAAGWPVRLNGKQNGVQPSGEDGWPLTSLSPGLPTSNAGTATVGVISRSKRARNRCTSVQSSWRRRIAWRYCAAVTPAPKRSRARSERSIFSPSVSSRSPHALHVSAPTVTRKVSSGSSQEGDTTSTCPPKLSKRSAAAAHRSAISGSTRA